MTKISSLKVDPSDMGKFINNFWVAVTLLQGKDEVKQFLKSLLTHTEMIMLSKRLQIAKMLVEGNNYEIIKNYIKVTDQTISRINNLLSEDGSGYLNAVDLLQKYEDKIQKELEESYKLPVFKKYPGFDLPGAVIDVTKDQLVRYKRRNSV